MRPPLGSLFAWVWAHREDLGRIAKGVERIADELTEIRKSLQENDRKDDE